MNFESASLGVFSSRLTLVQWCKDVSIKLRAYELLKAAQQKEGMW